MWYVKFRNNTKYGWRPIRFKWTKYPSFKSAAAAARGLHKTGWKEIHLTKKKNWGNPTTVTSKGEAMVTEKELQEMIVAGYVHPEHYKLTESGRAIRRALGTVDAFDRAGTPLRGRVIASSLDALSYIRAKPQEQIPEFQEEGN